MSQLSGAKGDGVADDTQVFVRALATSRYVVVPPGTYRISTFKIPPAGALELLPGAVLLVSDHIELTGRSQLIGYVWQNGRQSLNDPSDKHFGNIEYIGSAGGVPLRVAVSGDTNAWHIDGIAVDCKGISGTTGLQIGTMSTSGAYGTIGTLTIINAMANGVDIQAHQNSIFNILQIENTADSFSASGIGLNFRAHSVVTLIKIGYVSMTGFGTSVLMGDPTDVHQHPPSSIRLCGGVLQGFPTDGGVGLHLHACYDVQIRDFQIAGPGGNDPPRPDGTTVGVILGGQTNSYSARSDHVTIESCDIGNFSQIMIGYGWIGLWIKDNYFSTGSTNSNSAIFNNVGAFGVLRLDGYWRDNIINAVTSFPVADLNDPTGFIRVLSSHGAGFPENQIEGAFMVDGYQRELDSGSTVQLFPSTFNGTVDICIPNSANVGIVSLNGTARSTTIIADPTVVFSTVLGHAATINVYWDVGSFMYVLQNNTGSNHLFCIRPHGFTNFRQI
jgi:hypothetical protein